MKILRHFWEDIRQGENIDLYTTVSIAILLAALNLVGIAPETWIAPINLAVLALLAISVLGNRYRLETILQKMNQSAEGFLLKEYPDRYVSDLNNSKELWLVGMNLSHTVAGNYDTFKDKLRRGDVIKVLIVDPDSIANKFASFRSHRPVDEIEHRQSIMSTLHHLCTLKDEAPDRLEIRVLDYPFSFGATMVNPDSATGVIYLEHYAYKLGGDRPKLVIHPKDEYWYDFFKVTSGRMVE